MGDLSTALIVAQIKVTRSPLFHLTKPGQNVARWHPCHGRIHIVPSNTTSRVPNHSSNLAKSFLTGLTIRQMSLKTFAKTNPQGPSTELDEEMDPDMCVHWHVCLRKILLLWRLFIPGREEKQQRVRDCMAVLTSGILKGWIEDGMDKIWDSIHFEVMPSDKYPQKTMILSHPAVPFTWSAVKNLVSAMSSVNPAPFLCGVS